MNNSVFLLLSTVLLLSFAVHYADCVRFTIVPVPSLDMPCPGEFIGESCITLQQYIQFANPSSSDVTLELQPGNHQLDSQMTASSISSFTMIANTTATVTCNQQHQRWSYEWLHLNNVQNVYIRGINFSSCRLVMRQINNVLLVGNSFTDYNHQFHVVVRILTSSARIDQCISMNNTGSYYGHVYGSYSNIVISDSTFTDTNTRCEDGGAMVMWHCQLTIVNSRFVNNTGSNGGAIYFEHGHLMIAGSYFYNNSADSGNGGAVYFLGGNITVLDSTFLSNMANGGGGGAIYSGRRFTNVFLVNNTFIGNSAAFCGVLDIDEFSHYIIAIDNSN